ncbi:hypothetical protein B6U74_06875 [Candidatus Bathyarchaeota archaeon ex4484_205]|nr:MAG: hypothetical protein B6U74_06875 [Candidatus Bathyarchaeota archaeon ex4484_205]
MDDFIIPYSFGDFIAWQGIGFYFAWIGVILAFSGWYLSKKETSSSTMTYFSHFLLQLFSYFYSSDFLKKT